MRNLSEKLPMQQGKWAKEVNRSATRDYRYDLPTPRRWILEGLPPHLKLSLRRSSSGTRTFAIAAERPQRVFVPVSVNVRSQDAIPSRERRLRVTSYGSRSTMWRPDAGRLAASRLARVPGFKATPLPASPVSIALPSDRG